MAAGLASTVATEAVRRALVKLFIANDRLFAIAEMSLVAQLAPGARIFWRITMRAADQLQRVAPAVTN